MLTAKYMYHPYQAYRYTSTLGTCISGHFIIQAVPDQADTMSAGEASTGLRRRNPASTPLPGVDGKEPAP